MSLISQQDRVLAIKALEYYKTTIPLILNVEGELPSDITIKQVIFLAK